MKAVPASWTRIGDVVVPAGQGMAKPLPVSQMSRLFRENAGQLELQDRTTVRSNRWALTPMLVADTVDGRATLSIEAKGGTSRLSIGDVRALEAGHLLQGNVWYPLEATASAEILDLLVRMNLKVGALTLKNFLSLRGAGLDRLLFVDRICEVSPEIFGASIAEDGVPSGIAATLYPYQLIGWRWLRFLASHEIGGLLADEMGLGKTLQIISLISDAGTEPFQPVLVIAPGTLLENWKREFARFAPKVKVLVHHGSHRTGSPRALQTPDVVVTAYDTVVSDNGLLATVDWDAVILDEAQAIRNPGTARSAAVFSLRRKRGYAITGTPVENRLTDLWSIMNFVAPDYLATLGRFRTEYPDDSDGAKRLEPLVRPLMLRRRVAEVAQDLPDRIDIDVPLTMPKMEAEYYEILRRQALQDYGTAGPMVAITKLRQFCGHPLATGMAYPDPDAFPKLERLLTIAEEIFAAGDKVIIFSSFTQVSDLITSSLRRRLSAWVDQVDGRVATDKRQSVIDAFSAVSGAAALVLNPKVAGAGLNITAANHVVHYGLEWNPALEAQASARAWRRGQNRPVTIHRLFFVKTIEEVMNERLLAKSELSDVAVIGVEGSAKDTRDVLRALSVSPLTGAAE